MSDVGRQGHHRVINRDALPMPLQDTPADKRMSEVVDARCSMCTACNPAKFRT